MNRRNFLGVLCAAACAQAQETSRPDITLRIGPVTVEPENGKRVRTVGYNGSAPRPLLRIPISRCIWIMASWR